MVLCFADRGGSVSCTSGAAPEIERCLLDTSWSPGYGGAFFCEGADPVIRGNTITGCVNDTWGTAFYCKDASPTIDANMITGCDQYAGASTGTIDCDGGAPVITGNVITGNDGNNSYAAIYCHNHCSPTISGNVIGGNTQSDGIMLYIAPGSVVTNNVVHGNSGDGMNVRSSYTTAEIVNNTVYGNGGNGLYCNIGASPTVTNTIIRENATEIYPGNGSPVFTYCNVKGGWPGTGNIDADPLFSDATNHDFHLTWNSPCRGTGHNAAVTELYDFEGDPRIALGTVDMGADEFYYHLYHMGDVVPGTPIDIKVVGYPTAPITLYLGSGLADPPYSTQHGDFYLNWPPLWQGSIGTVPGNGVLSLPVTVPSSWSSGEEHPLQALVGPWNGPWTLLTNAEVLVVE